MPYADSGGVHLYYEEAGSGPPVVFIHEFANDLRGWHQQVGHFAADHRCVTFNARGYPPSDVPTKGEQYGLSFAVADIEAVMDHLGLAEAVLVGLSMGAFAGLHFALQQPHRVRGLVFASGGSGSDPATRERFVTEALQAADGFLRDGMGPFVDVMSYGPTRVQLLNKDPSAWERFRDHLAEHDAQGAGLTMRHYQARRPSLLDHVQELSALDVPCLVMAGDEDDPVIDTSLLLKRTIRRSGLLVLPRTGHAINLEEPAAFNQAVREFIAAVTADAWTARDERARADRSAMLPDVHTRTGA